MLLLTAPGCGARTGLDAPERPGPTLAIGTRHACLRTIRGQTYCWGDNLSNQVDDSPIYTPANYEVWGPDAVFGLTTTLEITAGNDTSCALMFDHTVRCWGLDPFPRCGGILPDPADYGNTPARVDGLSDVQEICTGEDYDCALVSDGTVWCWGVGFRGELGANPAPFPNDRCSGRPPAPITGLTDATHIACGLYHVCATRSDESVWCWGGGFFGELGPGRNDGDPLGPVSGLPPAREISATDRGTCVRDANDRWWCWGTMADAVFGPAPTSQPPNTPREATELAGATEIAVSDEGACAVFAGGELRCWGVPVTPTSVAVPGSTGRNPLPGEAVSHVGYRAQSIVCASTRHVNNAHPSAVYCWGGTSWATDTQALTRGSATPFLVWSEPRR